MSVYNEAGLLIIGSRLKRLSDRMLAEVSRVYKHQNIHFEPVWFPVFYLLDKRGCLSLTEIAQEADVSHSAISQLITQLDKKKLVAVKQEAADGRVKKIELTEKGSNLLQQIHPVWKALQRSLEHFWPEDLQGGDILDLLNFLEQKLAEGYISESTLQYLNSQKCNFEIIIPDHHMQATLISWLRQEKIQTAQHHPKFLAAMDQGHMAGFLAYSVQEDNIQILHLYVEKAFRRKGVATSLLARAQEETGKAVFAMQKADMELIRILVKNDYAFKVK